MRLKRLWSCNQRVLSYSMPAERVWDCVESAFSPAGPTQDTQTSSPDEGKECQSILITRALQSKLYIRLWTREVIRALVCQRFSLIVIVEWSEPCVAWLQLQKCVAKKPFGKLLVVNLWLELAKQAAPRTFSNESGVMDWEFGLVSGGAMIKQAFDDLAAKSSWRVGFAWILSTKAGLDEGSSAFQWQLSLSGLEKVIRERSVYGWQPASVTEVDLRDNFRLSCLWLVDHLRLKLTTWPVFSNRGDHEC